MIFDIIKALILHFKDFVEIQIIRMHKILALNRNIKNI